MKKSMLLLTIMSIFGIITAQTATVPRQVMIEHFSSSTCGPCVSVNNQMQVLTNNNSGKFCYVKYQMNWPGNGDPYYTAEGGVRRGVYGVQAVPHVVVEGNKFSDHASISQNQFNSFYAAPAYVDIRGVFSVNGNEITIHLDVFPNISIENVKLYVVVNEKVTHNNIGGNGESTFHHVMMKMLPNAQGTPINLVDGELQSFEFTHDMSGTYVEEMNDLEVAVFIQKPSTKEIYNSRFMYEYSDFVPRSVQNLQCENTGNNSVNVTWENPLFLSPSGYNVYVNNVLAAENIPNNQYSIINAIESSYTVQVEALYESEGMTSVLVTKTINMIECDAVTDVTAMVNDSKINVSWTAAPYAQSYSIYRSLNASEWNELATGISTTEYIDVITEEGEYCYKIKTICSVGESDFSEEVCDHTTTIDEENETYKIYPNPAKDFVKIEGENIDIISIYNTLGQFIKTVTVNNRSINISVNDLKQGIYIIEIKSSDTIVRKSVVIDR